MTDHHDYNDARAREAELRPDRELLSLALTALDGLLAQRQLHEGMAEAVGREVARRLREAGVRPAAGDVRRVEDVA